MLSFVHYLENAGYRKIDATAVKVSIVTLHSQAGVIIDPEEDAEMIRDNDRKAKKEEEALLRPLIHVRWNKWALKLTCILLLRTLTTSKGK